MISEIRSQNSFFSMLMSNQLQPDELFGLAGTTDTLQLFNDAGEIQNACTTNKIKRKFECLYFFNVFSGQSTAIHTDYQRYQNYSLVEENKGHTNN